MKPRLLWCDLETTGLDPDTCVPLEIACVVTTSELVELATFHRVIGYDVDQLQMSKWPWQQHTKSGLLDEVSVMWSDQNVAQKSPDGELANFIRDHTPDDDKLRLAGSSIHFDRSFMVKYLPRSLQELHYRQFDVSSFYELAPWMGIDFPSTSRPHRAMEDIKNSLSVARFFRERLQR